jgi:hypothetical protein
LSEIVTPVDHSRTADEAVTHIEGLMVAGVPRPAAPVAPVGRGHLR